MRKYSWLIFAVVLVWKLVLFEVATQPIPANDAYFYDGAVINKILHGGYFNPSLANALKISGTTLYSTYPPLHQAALYLWLSVVGVSGAKVIAFHHVLFAAYVGMLFLIFNRLKATPFACNVAGLFLFAITFQDRPDSLAELMGMLSIYCGLRAWQFQKKPGSEGGLVWYIGLWLFCTLNFCTSLQIGGICFGLLAVACLLSFWASRKWDSLIALAVMAVTPVLLVVYVKTCLPLAWAGFQEHLHQTPSYQGLRLPTIPDILKVVRTVPGIFVVAFLLVLKVRSMNSQLIDAKLKDVRVVLLLSSLIAAGTVVALSCFILTPNTIVIANYFQALIVVIYLSLYPLQESSVSHDLPRKLLFGGAILLASVRAIGMSTWGVACARDFSHQRAVDSIQHEVSSNPAGSSFAVSSAFLYDTAKFDGMKLIHSDWLAVANTNDSHESDANALKDFKPVELILTQTDYYRRFVPVLEKLRNSSAEVDFSVENLARLRSPDSYERFQRVVQHISWAPVIVRFQWKSVSSKVPAK